MAAEKSLHRTVVKIENTAHNHVIWKKGITMINKTYSVNIGEYQLAMATAMKLHHLKEERKLSNSVLINVEWRGGTHIVTL